MKTSSYIIRLKSAAKKYFEELEAIEGSRTELEAQKDKYAQVYIDNKKCITLINFMYQ